MEQMGARESVASNVRAEAARRGYTRKSLAMALGVGRTGINQRWNGNQPWHLDELDELARLFGMEPWELVKPPTDGRRLVAHPEGFEPPTFWLGSDWESRSLAPVIDLSTGRQVA